MENKYDVVAYISQYTQNKLRIQKLLYYAQVWSLVWTGKPLCNASFEAWDNGPVDPEVRLTLKARSKNAPKQLHNDSVLITDAVLDFYDDFSNEELISSTHEEGPWKSAYRNGRNTPITNEDMRSWYTKNANRNDCDKPNMPLSLVKLSTLTSEKSIALIDEIRAENRNLLDELKYC